MALGGEIHHHVRVFFLKELVHALPVADVQLHEAEVGVIHDRGEGGQVARVGQLVQTHDAVVRVLAQHMEDKIASDKSGAAGNDDGHKCLLFFARSSFALEEQTLPFISLFYHALAQK